MWNMRLQLESFHMLVLDGSIMLGVAAVLTSISALVWSLRRRP